MEAELMCGVCLEYFDKPLMLPCTHNFCKKCIEGILLVNNRPLYGSQPRQRQKFHLDCPLCQRSIELERGIDSLTVNRILENIIALHKKSEPLESNETAWKLDSGSVDSPCLMHNSEPMSLYCLTCNRAVCKLCDCVIDKSSGTAHKCVPIKEKADQYQMKISNAISEIKRKVVPINDEIQLMQDMLEQIKANEDSIKIQLENQISGLIQSLKSQQEELVRQLHNDIMAIKRPIEDHLRKHTQLKKTVDNHLKRVNSIKIAKDTGLRIKLMKESERQLNSLLCFDIPMFSTKDMPIVTMPVWEIDKESVVQSIHHLQWKKAGGAKPEDESSSTQSSRQSSREDDFASPPVTFEPPPSAMSFTDGTVTRSTMTKKQKPRHFDHVDCRISDDNNIQPKNVVPNIPMINPVSQQSPVSNVQPSFSSEASASLQYSTPAVIVSTTSSIPQSTARARSGGTPVVSGNVISTSKQTVKMPSPAINTTSWFTSTMVQSNPKLDGAVINAQPSTSRTQNFSNKQPKSNITAVGTHESATNINPVQSQSAQFVIPKSNCEPQSSQSDIPISNCEDNITKFVNFPVPRTADFIPQSSASYSSAGTSTGNSQNRGLPRKPKSEVTTSTLMAMVSDGGDIGMDTVIKSMETVRLGVKDDSNIPLNSSNIPQSNSKNIRIDRRASTGNAQVPTQSNVTFRTANLPTISARDFSPTSNRRSGSPGSGARRTLKPKKKISK